MKTTLNKKKTTTFSENFVEPNHDEETQTFETSHPTEIIAQNNPQQFMIQTSLMPLQGIDTLNCVPHTNMPAQYIRITTKFGELDGLLDTGANNSCISSAFALKIKATISKHTRPWSAILGNGDSIVIRSFIHVPITSFYMKNTDKLRKIHKCNHTVQLQIVNKLPANILIGRDTMKKVTHSLHNHKPSFHSQSHHCQ